MLLPSWPWGTPLTCGRDRDGVVVLEAVAYSDALFAQIALGDGRGVVQIFEKDAETLKQVCKVPRPGDVPGRIKALLTVQSTLLVGVWKFKRKGTALDDSDFTQLRVVDTKSRLTCLAVWAPEVAAAGAGKKASKQKRPDKTGEPSEQKVKPGKFSKKKRLFEIRNLQTRILEVDKTGKEATKMLVFEDN
eukprot:Skav206656  [mRNA]  locus=scaffold1933:567999:575516:+ [translate_table: standard]